MKAYSIDYTYNGRKFFNVLVDAIDRDSARNKIVRKHGHKASESKLIKIDHISVVGYF